ncbi:MAG: DNA-binding response regulator [Trueperaceae bacterium]|nr:MAG: DNA-binding response regulator [Trueperaceae bacterium]
MTRVLIVDDQTLVRQGIRSLLELADGIDVVGEAADGVEALERIETLAPDVVLLDLRMPRLDGIGVLEALRTRAHAPPCLILTTFDDDAAVLTGLRAGARGYLLKDVSLDHLTEAIAALAEGRTMITPALTERVMRGLRGLGTDTGGFAEPEALTERETEILRLMAGGYSNKEIANALDVAEGTVKNHVSSVLSKLGVRDRTRAVLKAVDLGLL